jgi:chromosome segregation ATPase
VYGPEVIRVSDSVPASTSTENARLRAQLEKLVAERRHINKLHEDEKVQWNDQQTQHEEREERNRKLLRETANLERALEVMTTKHEKARAQVEAQAVEKRVLAEKLNTQRELGLASADEKDVEITRLRKEIEAANLERDKAQGSAKTSETNLEYTKEQYRIASNTAGQLQTEVNTLQAQNKKLAQQASGEAAKVKALHLDLSAKNMMQQITNLKNENTNLKNMLKNRDADLIRAKNNSGRAAYGTRGQSTTPQPKTRSRAASPERGSNAPRGRGRISNLVAEER